MRMEVGEGDEDTGGEVGVRRQEGKEVGKELGKEVGEGDCTRGVEI